MRGQHKVGARTRYSHERPGPCFGGAGGAGLRRLVSARRLVARRWDCNADNGSNRKQWFGHTGQRRSGHLALTPPSAIPNVDCCCHHPRTAMYHCKPSSPVCQLDRTCMAAHYCVVAVADFGAAALPGLHLRRVECAAHAPRAMHLRLPRTHPITSRVESCALAV